MAGTKDPFGVEIDPFTGLSLVQGPGEPGIVRATLATQKPSHVTPALMLPSDAPWIPPSKSGLSGLTVGDAWLRFDLETVILEATVESTMSGASTVSLSIHDPDLRLLNSGLLQQRSKIRLGGFPFELVRVQKQDHVLKLEFEDAIVAELRTRRAYKAWKPGAISAIGVVRWFLSEKVKVNGKLKQLPGIKLYAPDDPGGGLATTQGVHGTVAGDVGEGQKREPGLAHKSITVKGVPASASQTDNANVVLKTMLKVKPRPTTAELVIAIMVCIDESSLVNLPDGDADSEGLFQQRPSQGWTGLTDRVKATQEFFTSLRKITGTPAGSAPAYQGTKLPALAQAVQRSGTSDGSNYARYEDEAKTIVAAFLGDLSLSGGTLGPNVPDLIGTVSGKPKTFHRGQKHTPEDSWTAMQRIARDVNYRCFVVGGILYFIHDRRLLGSESRLSINNGTEGVASLDFDIDVGQRVNKVEMTIDVAAWSTPPGSVVTLHDLGPANGDWLVDTVTADLKKPTWLDVVLTRPRVPLKESGNDASATPGGDRAIPAATGRYADDQAMSAAVETGSQGRQKVVAAALDLLGRYYNTIDYDHSRPFAHPPLLGQPTGLDCSAFVIVAFQLAGLPNPNGGAYDGSGSTYTLITKGKEHVTPAPGDLVFFDNPAHVVLAIGNGECIEIGSRKAEGGGIKRITLDAAASYHPGGITAIRSYFDD